MFRQSNGCGNGRASGAVLSRGIWICLGTWYKHHIPTTPDRTGRPMEALAGMRAKPTCSSRVYGESNFFSLYAFQIHARHVNLPSNYAPPTEHPRPTVPRGQAWLSKGGCMTSQYANSVIPWWMAFARARDCSKFCLRETYGDRRRSRPPGPRCLRSSPWPPVPDTRMEHLDQHHGAHTTSLNGHIWLPSQALSTVQHDGRAPVRMASARVPCGRPTQPAAQPPPSRKQRIGP